MSRIAIGPDGAPTGRADYATGLPGLPDGLAFDEAGNLYVSCYEPSRILRVDPRGKLDIYIEDVMAHLLCHPTNIAFDGATLYSPNLGRWHITRIATNTTAASLVSRANAVRTRTL